MIRKLVMVMTLIVALPCFGDILADMAEQGDADVQFALGIMYVQGQDVPQDYKEAVKWFRLAAEQGVAYAQYNLGVMYDKGQGMLQDDQEALKWYRLAAEQGKASAQYNLGVMYAKGQGMLQDYTKAHMWFNLGASQGHKLAQKNRDILAGIMTPAQIADAQKMARDWLAAHPDL